MTPRRIEMLVSAVLAIVALIVVSWLALDGVAIAQGALIAAVGTAVSHFMHTPQPPATDDSPAARRRATDPLPLPPTPTIPPERR